ncbi:DUF4440 domain-containing protein [Marinobacterium sp. D7]|uniref:YybH family protein n=1 Tax=Marinobacterium ramblicola TaxID=2849041 RepID=UPI001C2DBFAF|nr:DUF4440 domain-containing protein [Marinobacterium ramblicola]MBV1786860.1 DUF4440 domain-containing protein [Marinobacterium ramblicola]
MNTEQTIAEIIALERAALDRWGAGDPDGYLEISAPDVSYFDPFLERRIDGREALSAWYAPLRGTIHIERYDLIEPQVQLYGDTAVLTFNLISYQGEGSIHWNCSEVYRCDSEGWCVVQTHWSITRHLQM